MAPWSDTPVRLCRTYTPVMTGLKCLLAWSPDKAFEQTVHDRSEPKLPDASRFKADAKRAMLRLWDAQEEGLLNADQRGPRRCLSPSLPTLQDLPHRPVRDRHHPHSLRPVYRDDLPRRDLLRCDGDQRDQYTLHSQCALASQDVEIRSLGLVPCWRKRKRAAATRPK